MEEVTGLAALVSDYGFPIVMTVGLGYFIFFIWKFIGEEIDPALEEMHMALIKVIDIASKNGSFFPSYDSK